VAVNKYIISYNKINKKEQESAEKGQKTLSQGDSSWWKHQWMMMMMMIK
jgi:hypothetical protein